jgi:hypothetical protein
MACTTLLEVGTWNGWRAVELSRAALRRNPAVEYHGFDLFELITDDEIETELSKRPPSQADVETRLRRFRRRVALGNALHAWRRRRFDFSLYRGYTHDTLPALRQTKPNLRAQFIFIDGGHSIETIDNDWHYCSELVCDGGVIFLDDFYGNRELAQRFGCNALIEKLRRDPAWDVQVLPETDVIEELGSIQIARVRRR